MDASTSLNEPSAKGAALGGHCGQVDLQGGHWAQISFH